MKAAPAKISLDEWDGRYEELVRGGMVEPAYGGPLRRHVEDGDLRLVNLSYDNSAAALRLWNFLLSEEDRLRDARSKGTTLIGTMKDLGTIPVMAYALPNTIAFYPDGAWWIPCVMELSDGLFGVADSLGIDESFCPVRAMLGAFLTEEHFPIPDLLVCSVGAVCDDFSAIAQRLNGLGHPILWWEIPARRRVDDDEEAVALPGGLSAPRLQVDLVKEELARVRAALESEAGTELDDDRLREGIREANRVRRVLDELRLTVYAAETCPLPALEMLIAEMLAIHFCSDREEAVVVLEGLLGEAGRRVEAGMGISARDAARIFWLNPVADLRVMNLVEECGGRVCGTENLFCHAFDEISEELPPMEALARTALADPMIGPAADRARRVCMDMKRFGAEALVVSRIPGASHCATEGDIIGERVREELGLPVVELEVPPVSDALEISLRSRIEALVETVRARRNDDLRGH